MVERINTWSEPVETLETEKSIMEEATLKWQALKASIEETRQSIKAKWRNLLGLDLPHAENGQTIEPITSEVPPTEPDEVIPSSYGNLPMDTIPEKPVSLGTPEQQWEVQENTQEIPQNPVLAPRIVTWIVDPTKNQFSNLPRYIGPRPQTEEKEKSTLPPFHEVQAWETLYRIARKYNIDEKFLSLINKIADPTQIQVKQRIYFNESDKINADKDWIKIPEQQKVPEEEKKLKNWMTKTENYNLIKKTCEDWGVTDKNQIAYILATAEHESDMFNTWTEYSKWKLNKYWKIDPETGQAYYGRWYVQLTWKKNYQKYDTVLRAHKLINQNQSIVTNPDLVTQPQIAAFILVHGMINGNFGYVKVDGKDERARLGMFIDGTKTDWEGARYTVNGTDKKKKIAHRAQEILKTL
jgi:hypothetical protein